MLTAFSLVHDDVLHTFTKVEKKIQVQKHFNGNKIQDEAFCRGRWNTACRTGLLHPSLFRFVIPMVHTIMDWTSRDLVYRETDAVVLDLEVLHANLMALCSEGRSDYDTLNRRAERVNIAKEILE